MVLEHIPELWCLAVFILVIAAVIHWTAKLKPTVATFLRTELFLVILNSQDLLSTVFRIHFNLLFFQLLILLSFCSHCFHLNRHFLEISAAFLRPHDT